MKNKFIKIIEWIPKTILKFLTAVLLRFLTTYKRFSKFVKNNHIHIRIMVVRKNRG